MLREAVARAQCCSDVLRSLGLALAGGNHAHISRRIRSLGIDTSHFDPNAYSRGSRSRRRRPASEILMVLPAGSGRISADVLRRALAERGISEVCKECWTLPEWEGQFLRLVVDHVNGDWLDNRPDNLRFLCPNCHSQTATFCRRKSLPPR